ncbi:CIC11C00000005841 [Sungouiella intermedia]|uniref:CIC11C00000005841 n=1 Tax=Sungouiella intermedia TaxID=45354 RepID=A0A1L0DT35_9ASCO|nr:CIC11C00000005841 [[Candida] intermedia]
MTTVLGPTVDSKTRCVHYHLELDIIAIKFKCCNNFYPCYKCHQESATHTIETWPKRSLDDGEKVILCGECKALLDFLEYTRCGLCVQCGAAFNPKCSLHYDLYFDLNK